MQTSLKKFTMVMVEKANGKWRMCVDIYGPEQGMPQG